MAEGGHGCAGKPARGPAAPARDAPAGCRRPALSWIGDERIAVSGVPSARAVAGLAGRGVTHVVNCRPRALVRWSGDLAAERAAFGPERVADAPMRITAGGSRPRPGRRRRASPPGSCRTSRRRECSSTAPRAGAARPWWPTRCCGCAGTTAPGRRRWCSATGPRPILVPAYVRSVEQWLATAAR